MTIDESLIIKGVAIPLMLFYNLFNRINNLDTYYTMIYN